MIPSSTPQVDVVDESSGKRFFFIYSERLGYYPHFEDLHVIFTMLTLI